MSTGQNIKNARKKAGLTQKELAQKLGLSFQSIAQWENDLRNPKIETIKKIADALNVDWYNLVVPSSKEDAEKWQYIRSITEKDSTTDDLSDAEIIYNDRLEQKRQADLIKAYMSELNENGIRAAEQLMISVISQVGMRLKYSREEWFVYLMDRCFYDSAEYEEVANGIKALTKIQTYQRPTDSPQPTPAGSDDKEPAEK